MNDCERWPESQTQDLCITTALAGEETHCREFRGLLTTN